jgi:hypothetical protein
MIRRNALWLAAAALAGCGVPPGPFGYDPGPVPRPHELVLCPGSPPYSPDPENPYAPRPGARSRLVYHAWFPAGRLDCGFLDRIHSSPQPLKGGSGEVPGTTGLTLGPAASGALALGLTAPDPIPTDSTGASLTPSVGVFSTGLNLGPGAVFSVRATFRAPDGPHEPATATHSNAWAVGVAARTGNERDLGSEKRLGVTFRVRNQAAILNVQDAGAGGPLGSVPVPPEIYARIFGTAGAAPEPFTLELYVNRQTGKGVATLIPSYPSVRVEFDMRTFKAESGPAFTTAGASLANCCAPGKAVYVEVSDFRISQVFNRGFPPTIEPNIPRNPPIETH